jgi:hypothetical protein
VAQVAPLDLVQVPDQVEMVVLVLLAAEAAKGVKVETH